ncbi:AAA family ATPase [Dethiobacter alkaliphilus]|uniref:AAA family ATPase n=1 Tax=Dethiobacter alkaliphilus TaxID=427926 RepID=UPI00222765C0|nr:ATP-binding protein [Dethiobacter alkaliphilus]MCW3488816.1 ATP-binding protein [Dethiobacter alkaliphilus]
MLVNYRFSNFRSFKELTTLSMVAGRQTTLRENLIRKHGLRILPSASIYGANASGKSNIIMSLAVMKDIVLSGTLEASAPNLNNLELYPFAYNDEDVPMRFEIDFIHQDKRIEYAFEISLKKFKKGSRKIVFECLSVIDKSEEKKKIKIFVRDEHELRIMKDKQALKMIEFNGKLLKEFEKKINENLDPAELFLPRAFKSTINNELAESVLHFFKEELVVVSDFTLKKANLTFSTEEQPKKDFFLWNKILEGFVKSADFGPQNIAFKSNKSENENSADMELVSIYRHNNQTVVIPAELMESRGTLKLLDFAIPFEKLFKSGGVFVLDEFDAAIHPELIKGILALFNDVEINKAGAQLIFTTHNPIYLNYKIFRRDQIRFVEKDQDTFESAIYSLADFGSEEVRNDHNFLINYFKGNYGALPFIDFTKLLSQGNGEGEEDGAL